MTLFRAALLAAAVATSAQAQMPITPTLDIAGFQPRMTLPQVTAKLKAISPALEIKTQTYPILEITSGPVPWMTVGKTPEGPGRNIEQIAVGFTMAPSPPLVWSVVRSVRYADGQQPTVANTVAALRTKYGPPMVAFGTKQFYWGWDERGVPFPDMQMRQCAAFVGMNHLIGVTDTIYRPNLPNPRQEACLKGKVISADVIPAINQNLVASLNVAFTDVALEMSTMALTRAARQAGIDRAAAAQVNQARQNAPKL